MPAISVSVTCSLEVSVLLQAAPVLLQAVPVLLLAVPSPERKAGANLILLNFPIGGNGECAHYLSPWLCNLPHQVLLST